MGWGTIEKNNDNQVLITTNGLNFSYLYDPYGILDCVPAPAFTWVSTNYIDSPLNLYYAGVSFS